MAFFAFHDMGEDAFQLPIPGRHLTSACFQCWRWRGVRLDTVRSDAGVSERLPSARLVAVPGPAHMTPFGQPDAVRRGRGGFLARQSAPGIHRWR